LFSFLPQTKGGSREVRVAQWPLYAPQLITFEVQRLNFSSDLNFRVGVCEEVFWSVKPTPEAVIGRAEKQSFAGVAGFRKRTDTWLQTRSGPHPLFDMIKVSASLNTRSHIQRVQLVLMHIHAGLLRLSEPIVYPPWATRPWLGRGHCSGTQ
jgi:hypothetical protein